MHGLLGMESSSWHDVKKHLIEVYISILLPETMKLFTLNVYVYSMNFTHLLDTLALYEPNEQKHEWILHSVYFMDDGSLWEFFFLVGINKNDVEGGQEIKNGKW